MLQGFLQMDSQSDSVFVYCEYWSRDNNDCVVMFDKLHMILKTWINISNTKYVTEPGTAVFFFLGHIAYTVQ